MLPFFMTEHVWQGPQLSEHTPPVRPKILSMSGGVRMSLPITLALNPGAYFSMSSNTKIHSSGGFNTIEKYPTFIVNSSTP